MDNEQMSGNWGQIEEQQNGKFDLICFCAIQELVLYFKFKNNFSRW